VAGRTRPVTLSREQLVPVLPALAPLLPDGGLRRGSTVVIKPGPSSGSPSSGSTSLALALAVAASQGGSWCAAIGLPELGMVAAAGLGMVLARFALVPHPGEQWPAVTAAMVDAVDVVLVRPPRRTRAVESRRLMARARERGAVLVPWGTTWSEPADLVLSVVAAEWEGLGHGHGCLQARSVEVISSGRGAAARERRVRLWLPGPDGRVATRVDQARPVTRAGPASAAG
jgi:hypothetical protein